MTPAKPIITSGAPYLFLSLVGIIVPYLAFGNWLLHHGFDPQRFLHDLFGNGISTFFALDVLLSVVVLFTCVRQNKRLTTRQRWSVIAGTLCVGGSFGLPLYLFFDAMQRPRESVK